MKKYDTYTSRWNKSINRIEGTKNKVKHYNYTLLTLPLASTRSFFEATLIPPKDSKIKKSKRKIFFHDQE